MSTPASAPVAVTTPSAPLLVLEASTAAGSVALIAGGLLLAHRAVGMGAGRDDHLFPAVQSLLAEVGGSPQDLSGVVCGAGPGSFTSLRIAAAIAKGLAHGASVPLFSVSSLLLAAADAVGHLPPGLCVVHSDALRSERYVLDVEIDALGMVHSRSALQRLTIDQLEEYAGARPRLSVRSPAAPDLAARIVTPSAEHLSRVAPVSWAAAVPLDLWEPQYGRLAEAQVKWEASHGTPLPTLDAR